MRQSRAWGRRAYDLNPAASSARHPPQPTRRPNPPGGQTIRNPPYCPKVSRGNRSPASAFWPLAPIGRTPHLDTTSQSTPPPEYGLTLRPSRSTETQNVRDLPPCRRMANHDRSTRFNMKKWSGNARLSQRGKSRPFLNQSFESVSNLPWARPTITTAAGIETNCEPPTRKNEADRQRSPCSRGRYRS